ncbi:MAG: amino acid ABC transporter ATP-binding protein [Armatimonadetes bacterium]|nr:amino acid ABC transporter ATP-binding protein [Armatimonadota bacterium]
MDEPLLVALDVGRSVSQGEHDVPLLRGVDLFLGAGEVIAVVGPSGSGKTTLLRLLCALDEPTAGMLRCRGREYADWSPTELRRAVALVPQVPTVFGGNGWDNLWLPADLAGEPREATTRRLEPLLPLLGLDAGLLEQAASTLSVGQQQRLCLARAMGMAPAVLLLDEPTASLDPSTAGQLLSALAGHLRATGQAAVLVTHQMDHARALADRVMLLIAGQVVCCQPTAEFFTAPADEQAARFVAGTAGEAA